MTKIVKKRVGADEIDRSRAQVESLQALQVRTSSSCLSLPSTDTIAPRSWGVWDVPLAHQVHMSTRLDRIVYTLQVVVPRAYDVLYWWRGTIVRPPAATTPPVHSLALIIM